MAKAAAHPAPAPRTTPAPRAQESRTAPRAPEPEAERYARFSLAEVRVHDAGPRFVSGGRPLDPSTRARAETWFGVNLSHVRLHDDPSARSLAARHRARALTVGGDIVLGADVPAADTPADR